MIYQFRTSKGGQGCTVTACAFALLQTEPVLIVDHGGDVPAVLGLPQPQHDLEVAATDLVSVISADAYAADLPPLDRIIVHDLGTHPLTETPDVDILVTRPCYLALRRYTVANVRPDGIVVIGEPGRALTAREVSHCVNAPVLCYIPFDPQISRSVDAGLLAARMPHTLRPLKEVALCKSN